MTSKSDKIISSECNKRVSMQLVYNFKHLLMSRVVQVLRQFKDFIRLDYYKQVQVSTHTLGHNRYIFQSNTKVKFYKTRSVYNQPEPSISIVFCCIFG